MDFKEYINKEKLDEMSFGAVYGRVGDDAKALIKATCKKLKVDETKAALSLSTLFKEMAKQGIK